MGAIRSQSVTPNRAHFFGCHIIRGHRTHQISDFSEGEHNGMKKYTLWKFKMITTLESCKLFETTSLQAIYMMCTIIESMSMVAGAWTISNDQYEMQNETTIQTWRTSQLFKRIAKGE